MPDIVKNSQFGRFIAAIAEYTVEILLKILLCRFKINLTCDIIY